MIDYGYVVSALLTIMIISFVFKDTIVSKIAERSMIGVAVGYLFVIALRSLRDIALLPMIQGDYLTIIPVILGAFLYTVFIPSLRSFSRFSTSIIIGGGLGLTAGPMIKTQIIDQMISTITPPESFGLIGIISKITIFIGTATIIVYFLFTREAKGPVGYIHTIARWFMMVTFGVGFGNYVLGTMAKLLNRLIHILAPLL